MRGSRHQQRHPYHSCEAAGADAPRSALQEGDAQQGGHATPKAKLAATSDSQWAPRYSRENAIDDTSSTAASTVTGTWIYNGTKRDASTSGAFRLRAGTLGDTSWLHPSAPFSLRSKQPWIILPTGDQLFQTQPTDIPPLPTSDAGAGH